MKVEIIAIPVSYTHLDVYKRQARIAEITEEDTVLIIGAGPTGICTLLCSMPVSYTHLQSR